MYKTAIIDTFGLRDQSAAVGHNTHKALSVLVALLQAAWPCRFVDSARDHSSSKFAAGCLVCVGVCSCGTGRSRALTWN